MHGAKEIIKLNNGPEINAGQVRWIEHGNRHTNSMDT